MMLKWRPCYRGGLFEHAETPSENLLIRQVSACSDDIPSLLQRKKNTVGLKLKLSGDRNDIKNDVKMNTVSQRTALI